VPTCPAGNASSSMQNCWLTGELAGQHRITDAMAEAPPAKRRALAPCATAGGDDDGGGDEPNDVSVGGGHSRGSSCGDDICAVRQLCNAVGVGGEVEVCSQSFRRMGLPPWVRARVTDPGKCTVQYLETAASVTQVGAMTSMPHPTSCSICFCDCGAHVGAAATLTHAGGAGRVEWWARSWLSEMVAACVRAAGRERASAAARGRGRRGVEERAAPGGHPRALRSDQPVLAGCVSAVCLVSGGAEEWGGGDLRACVYDLIRCVRACVRACVQGWDRRELGA
jgi:hypothetical protein